MVLNTGTGVSPHKEGHVDRDTGREEGQGTMKAEIGVMTPHGKEG